MKILLIAIFISCSFLSYSQLPIDSATHLITYANVIKADGSKDQLYSRAREWFAKTYVSSHDVIQMDDKESGKIVGKALVQVYQKALGKNWQSGYLNYTISVYVKDGRYKYEISNYYHTGQFLEDQTIPDYGNCEAMMNAKGNHWQKLFNGYLSQLDENTQSLIASLKTAMNTPTTASKDF